VCGFRRVGCGDRALALLDGLAQGALLGIVVDDAGVVGAERVRTRDAIRRDVPAARGGDGRGIQLHGVQERQCRLQAEGEEGDRCC